MLTMADKGGGGVWTPPFLADLICEQPLTGTVCKGQNNSVAGICSSSTHIAPSVPLMDPLFQTNKKHCKWLSVLTWL